MSSRGSKTAPAYSPAECSIESYLIGHSIRFIPPLTNQELDCLWAELCHLDPETKRPTGFVCEIVKRFLKHKPNELYADEFLGPVLSHTWFRFHLYYNSRFMPPLQSWLAVEAYRAMRDFNRQWVPGIRCKEKYRPKAWVSLESLCFRNGVWTAGDIVASDEHSGGDPNEA